MVSVVEMVRKMSLSESCAESRLARLKVPDAATAMASSTPNSSMPPMPT